MNFYMKDFFLSGLLVSSYIIGNSWPAAATGSTCRRLVSEADLGLEVTQAKYDGGQGT